MRKLDARLIIGLLLVVGGVLGLLQSLNVIAGVAENIFWTVALAAASGFFFWLYFANPRGWWPLLPGFILLGIAVAVGLSLISPEAEQLLGGFFVLGGIGAAFWAIYFANRVNWWGAIPGGVLLTLAVVSVLDELAIGSLDTGGIFFLGLGLTFLAIYYLPTPAGRLHWAIFPAIPLMLFGIFIAIGSDLQAWNYIWPSAIILAGAYLLYRAFR